MIQVTGLVKSFGSRRVLDGIDLSIDKGAGFVIIGRSGVGKSVFLKMLLRLIWPEAGTIRVDGSEVLKMSMPELYRYRLKFGVLFQGSALFDSLTVEENVAFGLREHTRMPASEVRARVAECLEQVELPGIEKKMPSELSGGMKKRVALARAISMKPEILLFDEPTSGLDPITSGAINRLMIQLKVNLKATCVTVTHDMASAYRIADKICLLDEGRIRAVGTPDEIRRSRDEQVRRFVESALDGSAAAQISGKQ